MIRTVFRTGKLKGGVMGNVGNRASSTPLYTK